MESKIAKAIGLQYSPVALLWSNEKPAGAMQFSEGKWGCVMWLVAAAARRHSSSKLNVNLPLAPFHEEHYDPRKISDYRWQ